MPKRPNIVFITLDAWRYDALGLAPDKHWLERYGLLSRLHTPNLDRFASEGVYFSQAVATAPHTTSSHASIMTGLFPFQHGVRSFYYERLPDEIKTLAELLSREGYVTLTLREGEDVSEPGILQKVDVLRGFETVVHELEQVATLSRQAVEADRPVFAFLHLWDLHAPYLYSDWARRAGALESLQLKAQSLSKQWQVAVPEANLISEQAMTDFQQRIAASIRDVDLRIRTLFEWYVEGVTFFDKNRWPLVEAALKRGGLWDNTVVFVFGDHGEGVHPDGSGSQVFNHGKSLLDDQIRVPLLIHGLPGTSKHVNDQVSLADLTPTVLDLLDVQPVARLDTGEQTIAGGRSLLPLLNDSQREAPSLHFAELCRSESSEIRFVRQYLYQSCVRSERYKLLGHCGPVYLKRLQTWQDKLHRVSRGVGRRLGLSQGVPSVSVDDGVAYDRLYWLDLEADPDEVHPRPWYKVPASVVDLRNALDTLHRGAIRGPVVDMEDIEKEAVLHRLAALGYVER